VRRSSAWRTSAPNPVGASAPFSRATSSRSSQVERDLDRLVDRFLKDDNAADALHTKMKQLEARKRELETFLTEAEEPPPVLHPSMAVIYRERVSGLYEALQQQGARAEAADLLRSLVSEIVLTPSAGELLIDLRGDLAGILAIASSNKQKPGFLSEAGPELLSQVMMVAGTRNQSNYRFRRRTSIDYRVALPENCRLRVAA
jgi:site-specific DNA recombinase